MVSEIDVTLAVLGCHREGNPSLLNTAIILSKLPDFSTYGGAWFTIAWKIGLGQAPGFTAVYVDKRDSDGGRRMKIVRTS